MLAFRGAASRVRTAKAHGATSVSQMSWPPSARPAIARYGAKQFHSTPVSRSSTTSTATGSTASASSESFMTPILQTFDPLVPYLHQLPEMLGLSGHPHAYAISIVVGTFFMRTAVTLPFQIWSRRRMQRLKDEVVPRWNVLRSKTGLPERRMKETIRRQGRNMESYEVYKDGLEKELQIRLKTLIRKYRCATWVTIAVPLCVNLPLFLATSFTLRQSILPPSPLLNEILPWASTPAHLTQSFEASTQMLRDRGMDAETLALLSKPMGGTLGDVDSTFVGPLSLGMLAFLNTELSAWGRRTIGALYWARRNEEAPVTKAAAEERAKEEAEGASGPKESVRSQAVSTILRVVAIGFIPIACAAPSGLVLYWLSSITYSLAFNAVMTHLDRKAAAQSVQRSVGTLEEVLRESDSPLLSPEQRGLMKEGPKPQIIMSPEEWAKRAAAKK